MSAVGRASRLEPILSVSNLSIVYETASGNVQAVSEVSFQLLPGETLGIVGESGCGKSTAAMGVLQLLNPPGKRLSGSIMLNGTELTTLDEQSLRQRRWVELALIPQGAMNSLNPTMTVGGQLRDVIKTHTPALTTRQINQRVDELLSTVGLQTQVRHQYPHELSGGMKQRVCIAMAVALDPKVIIADEATSALDVVVQRQVARTLIDVKKRLAVSMILIGHDMGLMAQMSDRLMVMYAGKAVETGPTARLLENPQHPYTRLLIDALPDLTKRQPLKVSEGIMHDPRNPPPGCIFHLRCPQVQARCKNESPHVDPSRSPAATSNDVEVYCHFPSGSNGNG